MCYVCLNGNLLNLTFSMVYLLLFLKSIFKAYLFNIYYLLGKKKSIWNESIGNMSYQFSDSRYLYSF